MPDDPKTLTWYSKTNKRENSCTPVTCGCPLWFELHQQTAIKLLSNHTKNNEYKLEPGYEARAKRIAAIYAHLFLETLVLDDKAHPKQPIKFGNTNLRGRFYWMGLGAFASKTMAMVFGDIRTQLGYSASHLTDKIRAEKLESEKIYIQHSLNILAKGNLWLAMDIIPWHLAWANDKAGFKDCIAGRDFSQFPHLKPAIDSLPWASSVPNMINQLRYTPEIYGAFVFGLNKIEEVFGNKKYTEQKKFDEAKDDLLYHLKQIAIQEQKNILQKICWNDSKLRQNVRLQRDDKFVKHFSLDTTLVLSRHYTLKKTQETMKDKNSFAFQLPVGYEPWSSPPNNIKIEEYGDYKQPESSPSDSRMYWILKGATPQYHKLMLHPKGRAYLIDELTAISKWVNDSTWIPKFLMHASSNDGKI